MAVDRAIIFDLDDTLYPERDYAFSGFDVVADAFRDRLPTDFDLSRRMRDLFDSSDRHRVFNAILSECGEDDDSQIVLEMVDVFRSHSPNIQLHADADNALSRLRKSCRIGLITDGFAVAQWAKIAALKLQSRLDKIIVTDEWGEEFWKPHPRSFEAMSAHFGIDPGRCTYVADNPAKDFIAPNALGWRTVFIKRPGGIHSGNHAPENGVPGETITTLEAI